MTGRGHRWPSVLLVLGLAVAGSVMWVVGVVGTGQLGEDLCLDDPPAEATGYQTEGSLWPPRLTCIYDTREGGTLEVDHWLYAAFAVTWVIGVPLVAVAGIATVGIRGARARRVEAAGTPDRPGHLG